MATPPINNIQQHMSADNNASNVGISHNSPNPAMASRMSVSGSAMNANANSARVAAGQTNASGVSFSSSDMNRLLLEYLNRKGYHRMEAMLRAESARTLTPKPSHSPVQPRYNTFDWPFKQKLLSQLKRPVTNPIAATIPAKRQSTEEITSPDSHRPKIQPSVTQIKRSFLLLKNYVDKKTLLFHKPQFTRILYAIYILCSLEISKITTSDSNDNNNLNHDFLSMYASYFNDYKKSEDPKMLPTEEMISNTGTSKIEIEVSAFAFYSFMFYLLENENIGGLILLDMMEKSLQFILQDVVESPIQASNTEEPKATSLTNTVNRKDQTSTAANSLMEDDLEEENKALTTDGSEDTKIKVENLEATMSSNSQNKIFSVQEEYNVLKETYDALIPGNLQSALPNVQMFTFNNTDRDMTSLEFSSDCKRAATGFQDSYIKIWSLDGSPLVTDLQDSDSLSAQELRSRASKTLVGHNGTVYSASFSPDNKYLLSSSGDKTVRLWSMDNFEALVSYKGHDTAVWDVAFSGSGNNYFATASSDQTAKVWTCDRVYPIRILAGHLNDVDHVAFHPNGRYVFTGSSDKTCRMWDIESGDSVRLFIGHMTSITSLSVSPDGRWLCTGSEDGIITVWDIGTGKKLKNMRGHGKSSIHSVSYNRNGNVLLSGGADHSVRVWDLKKNTNEPGLEPEEQFVGYMGDTNVISLNQDIKEYSRRRTIIATNDLLASFYTRKTPVFNVKFMRDNLAFAGGVYIVE